MTVAIIDVGSNTVRLLVAASEGGRLAAVYEEREYLGLGVEIERLGRIGDDRIARAAGVARAYARTARRLGVERLDVLVTAPGRQGTNADVLVAALACSTGASVRVLGAEEEGRLAYEGAVALSPWLPETVGVCDVGGGSTELLVGTRSGGPAWWRSLDIGSLRLSRRFLPDDPPGRRAIAAVRAEVERSFAGLTPPLPKAALATGGSARALRKLSGRKLGERELEEAVRILGRRPSSWIAESFGIDELRARTLVPGAIILLEAHRRLGVTFHVARGGLREGAALGLLAELAAA